MIEIIPTVVPASLDDIAAVAARYKSFAPVIHIDIADGVFAPNTTWIPQDGEELPSFDGLSYEAHLMVAQPLELGCTILRAGASRIIGHVEAMRDVEAARQTLRAWHNAGASEAGLGILFATPLESLDALSDECDLVQMMSIASIGVQGIPYESSAPSRIEELHGRHPELLISVDGGVNETNIVELARSGARRFCAGSVLSKSSDPASTYRSLTERAQSAIQ